MLAGVLFVLFTVVEPVIVKPEKDYHRAAKGTDKQVWAFKLGVVYQREVYQQYYAAEAVLKDDVVLVMVARHQIYQQKRYHKYAPRQLFCHKRHKHQWQQYWINQVALFYESQKHSFSLSVKECFLFFDFILKILTR